MMSWRVLFTGAVCLLLVAAIGIGGYYWRAAFPGAVIAAGLLDVGIVVGGVRTMLELTKTATELQKMGMEIDKLQLEVAEKRRAVERSESMIVRPTAAEVAMVKRSLRGFRRETAIVPERRFFED